MIWRPSHRENGTSSQAQRTLNLFRLQFCVSCFFFRFFFVFLLWWSSFTKGNQASSQPLPKSHALYTPRLMIFLPLEKILIQYVSRHQLWRQWRFSHAAPMSSSIGICFYLLKKEFPIFVGCCSYYRRGSTAGRSVTGESLLSGARAFSRRYWMDH